MTNVFLIRGISVLKPSKTHKAKIIFPKDKKGYGNARVKQNGSMLLL